MKLILTRALPLALALLIPAAAFAEGDVSKPSAKDHGAHTAKAPAKKAKAKSKAKAKAKAKPSKPKAPKAKPPKKSTAPKG